MVIPLKFAKKLTAELDLIETDPKFALFIESLYQDTLENPEKLWTSEEVWGDDIHGLIEGVDINYEEESFCH